MPEITAGRYLVTYLLRWGPTRAAGMGSASLKPDQVAACAEASGIGRLQPWEVDAICDLSSAYAAESQKAERQGSPPPWLAPGEKPEMSAAQIAARAAAEEAAQDTNSDEERARARRNALKRGMR